eukprot:gene47269-57898_t
MHVPHHRLDGSTPAAERTKRVAAFQRGEGEVFLISLKAGGFGLNLTMADYVLIVDPWWNPAAEDQASGRAHRMGQQRPVTVYRLVTAGSVEERIIELHRDKRGLAEGMLEGHEQASPLDAAALAGVLAPKIAGTWALERLVGADLDFFVSCSSLSAVLPAHGQANYAAGNAFLDAHAHWRRAQGRPGLSVNWGPWSEVGFATSEFGRRAHARLESFGLRHLAP